MFAPLFRRAVEVPPASMRLPTGFLHRGARQSYTGLVVRADRCVSQARGLCHPLPVAPIGGCDPPQPASNEAATLRLIAERLKIESVMRCPSLKPERIGADEVRRMCALSQGSERRKVSRRGGYSLKANSTGCSRCLSCSIGSPPFGYGHENIACLPSAMIR